MGFAHDAVLVEESASEKVTKVEHEYLQDTGESHSKQLF